MARAGNTNIKGSVKVDFVGGEPVFLTSGGEPTNNGSFKRIERLGLRPGRYVIFMDEEAFLSPSDIIESTIDESSVVATTKTEFVDQTKFNVVTTDGAESADVQFAVVIYEQFKG